MRPRDEQDVLSTLAAQTVPLFPAAPKGGTIPPPKGLILLYFQEKVAARRGVKKSLLTQRVKLTCRPHMAH